MFFYSYFLHTFAQFSCLQLQNTFMDHPQSVPQSSSSSHSQEIRQIRQSIMNGGDKKQQKASKMLQNGYLVNLYFQRLRVIDFSLFITILSQLVLLHCYYEYDVLKDDQKNQYGMYFLYFSNLTQLFGILFLILRHIAYNQLQSSYYQDQEQSSIFLLIFNICIFLITPLPWINDMEFKCDYYSDPMQEISSKYNYVLIIFSVFRLVFCINFLFLTSKYLTPRSNRICKMYGAYPGIMYCIRSTFKDEPFYFVTAVFGLSVLVFSFVFRIAEGDFAQQGVSAVYQNMSWMTIITMTTVGYGDTSPKTDLGRLIGCICVSWGVLIVSVMVVVLTNTFSMNRNQWQALSILKKLEIKKFTRNIAAKYIRQAAFRLYRNKKLSKNQPQKMKQRKLKLAFQQSHRIETMNISSENEIDLYNEMAREFERAFINLENLINNNLMIINHLHDQYISNPSESN